jgi:hypothetical protein
MKTENNNSSTLIIVAAAALVMLGFAGISPLVYVNSPDVPNAGLLADNSTGTVRLALYDVSGKFDRSSCELNCRSSYRYDWSSDSPLYYGCIQKCTDQAWNNFFGNKKKDDYTVR